MQEISVILPVYNGADMLEDCLRSVLDAGSQVAEIIIVDDGSIDNTLKTARELEKVDKRVKVIHTENQGSYMARVTGIRAAISPYLAFIDVDDRFTAGALDFLADLQEETNADIVMGGYLEVDSLEMHEMRAYEDGVDVYTADEMWPRLMKWRTQEFLWYLWHKLYKRELFQNLVTAEGLCQGDDVLLSVQAFLKAVTIAETKRIVYLYYQNPNSMLHSRFGDKDLDLIRVWDKVVDLTKGKNVSLAYGKSLHELALFNRWRTDFTLMTRLILADDRELDKKYASNLQEWRTGLRNHWKDLVLPHAMPKSREILIVALRFSYGPAKGILRLVNRFRKRIG